MLATNFTDMRQSNRLTVNTSLRSPFEISKFSQVGTPNKFLFSAPVSPS